MQPRIVRRVFSPVALALLALLVALAADARAVTIAWVPVGNPGNPADTGVSSLGAVNYSYSIGKYDVTVSQYVEFLNAKDPTGADTLGLYNNTGIGYATYGQINFSAGKCQRQQVQRYSRRREPSRELRHLVRRDPLCQLDEQRPGERRHGDGSLYAAGRHAHAQQRSEHHAQRGGADRAAKRE